MVLKVDAGMLAKGPLGLYIAYVAEQEDVGYRMFERDDVINKDRVDDESFFKLMKDNNPMMFGALKEELNNTLRKGK